MVGRDYCSAINCTNSRKSISALSMFRVPKDPVRSKDWVTNCGRKDLLLKDPNYLYDNISFCSAHFEDSQFINTNRNRLVWNAVPTLFDKVSDIGQIGLDPTTSRKNPSPVENVEIERNQNPTIDVSNNLCLSNQKPIKIICKPSIVMRKFSPKRDDCQSNRERRPTSTETKDTNPNDEVELPKKIVSQKNYSQSTVKLLESKSLSNRSNLVSIQSIPKKKFIILNNKSDLGLLQFKKKVDTFRSKLCIPINNSTNRTLKTVIIKRNVKALNATKFQSTAKCIETKVISNLSVETGGPKEENESHSSAKSIGTNEIRDPTDDVNKEENEEQSSAIFNDSKRVTNPSNEVEIGESECQSSAKSIENNDMKNPTNEVDEDEKEDQSLVRFNKSKGIINSSNEVGIGESEYQSSDLTTETKDITNPTGEADIGGNECQSSANGSETEGTINPAEKIDTLTKCSNPTNEEEIQLHPPENNSLTITSESSQYKKKVIKPTGKKISLIRKIKVTNKRTLKPGSLKRKYDALKENECQCSAKKTRYIRPKIVNDKVGVQDKSGPKTICYSLVKNDKLKSIHCLADEVNKVKLCRQKTECQPSILLSSVKKIENKSTPDLNEKVQTVTSVPENDSELLNDEFSQYKKKVEAFTQKILSPQFKPNTVKKTTTSAVLHNTEFKSSVLRVSRKGIQNTSGKINQVKKDLKNIEFRPSTNYIKRVLNPTDKVQFRSGPPENYSIVTKSELIKCKEKIKAYEKIIDGLKTERKSEARKLKKVIKELRRRIRRKEFLIKKLRRERSELKSHTSPVKSKSKASFRRDRHIVEETLSKYMSKEALNIVMSQMKPPTSYGSRWDDEIKMFALNMLQSSPKAYKILCSYLHLPTTRTLQRFIQGVDLIASSGLHYNETSDVAGNNEGNTELGKSSNVGANSEAMVDPETVPLIVDANSKDLAEPGTSTSIVGAEYEVVSDPEMVSVVEGEYTVLTDSGMVSVVEGDYEVVTDPELISSVVEVESSIPQSTGKEKEDTVETKEIIYYITSTDQECEVITGDYIPAQD